MCVPLRVLSLGWIVCCLCISCVQDSKRPPAAGTPHHWRDIGTNGADRDARSTSSDATSDQDGGQPASNQDGGQPASDQDGGQPASDAAFGSDGGPLCPQDRGDCDGDPSNGCETPLNTIADCGACKASCSVLGGTAVCMGRPATCRIGRCESGLADCDGVYETGCEIDTSNDAMHCGACGRECAPHADGVCARGLCTIAACDTGFHDCDGSSRNGCESVFEDDPSNCGGCGLSCITRAHAEATCVASSCGYECLDGMDNCDRLDSNGCETNLLTSTSSCGACGVTCRAPGANMVASCDLGLCQSVCSRNYADCNGDLVDGCEINTQLNEEHCGSCGNTCALGPDVRNATPLCMSGACRMQCNAGYRDCNGNSADGCETMGTCP